MRINLEKSLLVGAIAVGMAAINAQAGLTHRYSFNDSGTPGKDSVGTANATLMNMTSDNIGTLNSHSGTGLYFNNIQTGTTLYTSGNTNGEYVSIPTNVINGATALTLESWSDLSDSVILTAGTWSRIYDIGDPFLNGGQGHNFLTYSPHTGESPANNNRVEFNINGNGQTAEATGTMEGYHHIVTVIDPTNGYMEVYQDGVRTAHASTTYKISDISNKVFWLGRSEWSGDSYLYGYIDEFRIYDRALSGAEIAANYAVGTEVVNPNLTSTLGAVQTIYLSDPGHIVELHSANTIPTGDFANAGFTGLQLLNAPGFTLTSSDPTVATVNGGGLIKALKPGTTTITATYGGKTATLVITVDADTVAPTIVSANPLGYDKLLQVTFSKPVTKATAENLANYSIDQGVTISRAVLNTNGSTVVTLYTTQFDINSAYTLTVNGVQDTVFTPNTIVNATKQFGSAPGAPLTRRLYYTTAGYQSDTLAHGEANSGFPYSGGTVQTLLNGLSDTAGGHGDNYFAVVSGWLIAPTSDTYHFGLASDDDGAIYVSPTDKEADLPTTPTFQAAGWSPAGHFTGAGGAETYTGPNSVSLTAGNKYFFRAEMRNGTGGDNWDVAWAPISTPITDGFASIPAAQVQPINPPCIPMSITTQPVDVSIGQNNDATFTVAVASWPLYTGVQWYSVATNGTVAAITNGGNSLTYTAALVTTNMNGMKFFAVVSNLIDTVTTTQAKLTVSSDNIPPQLILAVAGMQIGASATNVTVYFNERVSAVTAGNKANYAIGGFTVSSATYDTVTLTNVYLTLSSPMSAGAAYTLTVNNVKDLAGNVIDSAHKSIVFHAAAYAPGYVVTHKWNHSVGNADDIIAWAASNPQWNTTWVFSQLGTSSWAESDWGDNISTLTEGLLVPPVTGDYVFYDSSDDSSNFYIDPIAGDMDPNNLQKQCSVSGWTNQRDWAGGSGGGNQKSSTVTLQAGQRYYFRETWAQGGGGAGFMVDWVIPGTTAIVDITGTALLTPASMDLSSVTITTNPVSTSVMEGQVATFTAAGTGTSQFNSGVTYQWLMNGSPVAGATSATFQTKPWATLAMNNAQIACVISEPLLSKTTSVATLTVTVNTSAFAPVSAGVLTGGTNIGVKFNQYADPVSAVDITKYSIPGATIVSASYRTNIPSGTAYGDLVELTVANPPPANAHVVVTGVKSAVNHAGSGTVPIQVVPNLISLDLGVSTNATDGGWFQTIVPGAANADPVLAGLVIPESANSFEITAGGSDIWGQFDNCQFLYTTPPSENFDIRVRVISQRYSSTWAKVGLMVRESLDAGSRNLNMVVDPTPGANVWESNCRLATSSTDLLSYTNNNPNNANNCGGWDIPNLNRGDHPPTYPNAWIRIVCSNNVYMSYLATNADGSGWVLRGKLDLTASPYAAPYVGICVTAHDNTLYNTTEVADFSLAPFVMTTSTTLTAVNNPDGSVTISWPATGGTLYQSTDLKAWAPSSLTPAVNGSTSSVTIAKPSGMMFYNLK